MNHKITKAILALSLAVGVTVVGKDVSADTVITAKAGDTVWDIAQAHNTTVGAIESINPDIDNNTHIIFVGQEIKVNENVTGDEVVNQGTISYPAQQVTPVKQETPAQSQPAQSVQPTATTQPVATNDGSASAKEWIAQRESDGSYTAQNGQYYGKYQLSLDKLNGDLSPANQEKVANEYAVSRYGSWGAAKSSWIQQGWW